MAPVRRAADSRTPAAATAALALLLTLQVLGSAEALTIGPITLDTNLLGTLTAHVLCDYCRDGTFDSAYDSYVSGVQVTLTCTIQPPCLTPLIGCPSNIVVTAQATSDTTGLVTIPNLPTVSALTTASPINLYKLLGCVASLGPSSNSSCNLVELIPGQCNIDPTLKATIPSINSGATLDVGNLCFTSSGASTPAVCPPSGFNGDPHFTGGNGVHFDFTGEPGKHYCMVSDSHLHINMFYDGRYGQWGENPHKAMTWIRKLGILWGHHTIVLEARTGSSWKYEKGYMARMAFDGQEFFLGGPGSLSDFEDKDVLVKWSATDKLADVYELRIRDVLEMRITLKPEVANLRTADDGVIHFNVEIPVMRLSSNAHGVLGQTFRPITKERQANIKKVYNKHLQVEMVPGDNAEGLLDGAPADYENKGGLLTATCKFARFARAGVVDEETAQAMDIINGPVGATHTYSSSSSRKLLRM